MAFGRTRDSAHTTALDSRTLEAAETLLRMVSLCMDNILRKQALERSFDDARNDKDRLHVLLEFARQVTANLSINDLTRYILTETRTLTRCDRCDFSLSLSHIFFLLSVCLTLSPSTSSTLFLADDNTQELVAYMADGISDIRLPITSGLVGLCATSGLLLLPS